MVVPEPAIFQFLNDSRCLSLSPPAYLVPSPDIERGSGHDIHQGSLVALLRIKNGIRKMKQGVFLLAAPS